MSKQHIIYFGGRSPGKTISLREAQKVISNENVALRLKESQCEALTHDETTPIKANKVK